MDNNKYASELLMKLAEQSEKYNWNYNMLLANIKILALEQKRLSDE